MGSSGSGAEPALGSRGVYLWSRSRREIALRGLLLEPEPGDERLIGAEVGVGAHRWLPAPSRLRIYLVLFTFGSCLVCVVHRTSRSNETRKASVVANPVAWFSDSEISPDCHHPSIEIYCIQSLLSVLLGAFIHFSALLNRSHSLFRLYPSLYSRFV